MPRLPGGLIEGSGNMRYAQTMAFTTLMLFQLFNVFNARSDERSAFDGLFRNHWLWAAVGLSLAAPGRRDLCAVSAAGLLDREPERRATGCVCAAVASSVLWLRELSKMLTRGASVRTGAAGGR